MSLTTPIAITATTIAGSAMRDRLIRFVGSAVRAGEHVKGDYSAIPPRVLKRLQSLGYIK